MHGLGAEPVGRQHPPLGTPGVVGGTLRGGGNACNHLVSLMRRKSKSKIGHLDDFHKYCMRVRSASAKSSNPGHNPWCMCM